MTSSSNTGNRTLTAEALVRAFFMSSLTPRYFRCTADRTQRCVVRGIASRTDLLRMSPSEGYAQFDMPVPPYLCRNTVHFGGSSWIDLTEVPTAGTSPEPR